MVIGEEARQELFDRLQRALGRAAATTLMEYLPPVGWSDVATKRDLEVLEHRIRADVRAEINSAVTSQTRTILFAVVGSNLTMAAVALAAATVG
ncbi:MAG: hypothetical protein M3203_04570 [Actinomycetota bacterium]|nr:hypothetical protein [Actinomycetota bacterium]